MSARRVTQAAFLILFAALIAAGKSQIWMGLFLLSVVLAVFIGRIYCGWLCPINTVIELIVRVERMLGVQRLEVPEFIKKPVFRYLFLAVFIATMAFVLVSGKKLPVLIILLLFGAVLSMIFHESIWHRYLCPYGTILNATGSRSRRELQIDREKCRGCGVCRKVCPGGAVNSGESYSIDNGLCLQCLECLERCPRDAISFR